MTVNEEEKKKTSQKATEKKTGEIEATMDLNFWSI